MHHRDTRLYAPSNIMQRLLSTMIGRRTRWTKSLHHLVRYTCVRALKNGCSSNCGCLRTGLRHQLGGMRMQISRLQRSNPHLEQSGYQDRVMEVYGIQNVKSVVDKARAAPCLYLGMPSIQLTHLAVCALVILVWPTPEQTSPCTPHRKMWTFSRSYPYAKALGLL